MLLFHHFDGKDKLGWSLVELFGLRGRSVVTNISWVAQYCTRKNIRLKKSLQYFYSRKVKNAEATKQINKKYNA